MSHQHHPRVQSVHLSKDQFGMDLLLVTAIVGFVGAVAFVATAVVAIALAVVSVVVCVW